MTRISGVSTQTNTKGIITKITIDLKKHPKAVQPLTELGLMGKTEEELYREEFYKKVKDPTNLTPDEALQHWQKTIDRLWDK